MIVPKSKREEQTPVKNSSIPRGSPFLEDSTEELLRFLWEEWEETRVGLRIICGRRGVPLAEQDLLVDEVMHRLLTRAITQGSPRSLSAWCRVVLGRLIGEWRKHGVFVSLHGNQAPGHASQATGLPGAKDFWDWIELHEALLLRRLSLCERRALFSTRDAPSIQEAAFRCGQSKRNYRILINRVGMKIFSLIAQKRISHL